MRKVIALRYIHRGVKVKPNYGFVSGGIVREGITKQAQPPRRKTAS
jgi:hypothetical protein